jgi:hypothetical protein
LQDALYGDRLPQDYPYSARKVVQQHVFGLRKKGYNIRVHHNYGYELLGEIVDSVETAPPARGDGALNRSRTERSGLRDRTDRRRALQLN